MFEVDLLTMAKTEIDPYSHKMQRDKKKWYKVYKGIYLAVR